LLLLERKSNQNASAHLRWLFAQPLAHEKNALLSGISSFKILLVDGEFFESIPRPIPSHKSSAFFPFFRQGNEPGAKGLPSEGWCLDKLETPGRGEIFFKKSSLSALKKIVSSSYDYGMTTILKKIKNRFFASL